MDAPLAYARRTLVNAHIDLTRKSWWNRERPTSQPGPQLWPAAPDEVDAVDTRQAVVAALLALPPGQRRVVVLRFLSGLSVRETAVELGISPGTVKSQTSDALRSLAVVLTASENRTDG